MILSIFNSNKAPKAFLLCAALLLATELYVGTVVHKLWPPSLCALMYKQQKLERTRDGYFDMIVMGDSRFMGLNAQWLQEDISAAVGREFSVYNYAMLNQGIRSYTLLLRKYLRHYRPPRYILFGSAPLGITGEWAADKEPGRNSALHYLAQMYSLPELLGVLPCRSWPTIVEVKIERLSKLVLYREAIKKAINNRDYFFKDYLTPAARFLDKNNGGFIIGGFVTVSDDDIRRSKYYHTPLQVDPAMDRWYREFFALARENNITVLMANSPIARVLYEERQQNGSNARYAAAVRGWQQAYPNLTVIPPLLQPYPVEDFKDWHHLNLEGTYKYIDELLPEVVEQVRRNR